MICSANGFPGWPGWFSILIFCRNNKIHFSLANANDNASFTGIMVLKSRFSLGHNRKTNMWIKAATDSALSEQDRANYRKAIRLQDLENSARSKASGRLKGALCFLVQKHRPPLVHETTKLCLPCRTPVQLSQALKRFNMHDYTGIGKQKLFPVSGRLGVNCSLHSLSKTAQWSN